MLLGLSLGLIIAGIVYVRGLSRVPTAASALESRPTTAAEHPTPPKQPPKAATSSKGSSPPEKRFDFYDILPQYEVVVPDVETPAGNGRPARAAPVEEPGSYVLQVGSFSGFADADRLQAKLALLGIESRVQRVTIDDDVFHRVRIGPITNLAELNRVRSQLRDAGLDSMLLKVQQ